MAGPGIEPGTSGSWVRRGVRVKIISQLARLVAAGMGVGVDWLRVVVIRFRGARFVRKLALQVYKNICNNIFNFGNLFHSAQEVGRIFFSYCVLENNVIRRTDAVHVWPFADVVSYGHPLWWRDCNENKLSVRYILNRVRIIWMTSLLSQWLILHALSRCFKFNSSRTHSDHFIWYEKAFLTCPMGLVSNRKSVICIFVQVSPASYEGQK